ncbi:TonB-dependent receptor [Rhizorhabdus dicambivorans]|uniref:TonB-dependent receptor n=1 Tax=Rhizorhabdus dicambivorans TaxID=1850238 RepID=A0A2A4FSV1_9SPHN|nr:TonB-dependent receptor [Rhizorhabdus dicambivorans]ATE64236.1 hypothetical protein CMV14_07375 [Rhizorhabdus dicambivorans]PCE40528.1 hypothetical protein COO09_19570 [Rhizorhabdus dicambivorans]
MKSSIYPHSPRGNFNRRTLQLATASTLALALMAPEARAQSAEEGARSVEAGIGDIVVTARRREEKLQDVPQAVSVMTQDQLKTENVRDQNDLQQKIPSLSVASRFGRTGGTYGMRGLSGQSSTTPTVGTYFAEVPTPTNNVGYDGSAGQSLYDLQSVQVLKGPQGTLFGRTTTAGAVLVTPAAPHLNDVKANGSLGVGTLGYFQGTLAVSVPIIDGVLAVRAAANYNHRRGYTKVIGSDKRLDELNNESQRISVLFEPTSWLKNTTIYDRFHSDQASSAYLALDYNRNFGLFNLPANTPFFNGICAQAVAVGLASSVPACAAQRLGILASLKATLDAEVTRVSRGGKELRRVNAGNTTYFQDRNTHETLVNRTELALPDMGPLQLQLKNIFGYQTTKGYSGVNVGGIDELLNLYVGVGTGLAGNQSGTKAVISTGKGEKFYSNETQLSGNLFDDRLVFVGGYYYQHAPSTPDLTDVGGVQKTLGGVTAVNLGFSAGRPFTVGGRSKQSAFYGQTTLGLDGLIDGLHLTGGVRRTKDDFILRTRAAGIHPLTGVISPSIVTINTTTGTITLTPSPVATQSLKTSGTNYNFSIDYKATSDLLLYVSTRKGYVPGGLNNSNAAGAPNFQLQYGSETIKDVEAGVKWDFNLGGTSGRFNLAGYQARYSGIQRSFTAIVNGAAISYVANVAKAKLRGIEAELTVLPTSDLRLGVNYSYNEAKYTQWVGADPYGAAPVGTNIDLSDNPFQNAPKHKVNLNATYEIPLSGDNGAVSITGQYTYQSKSYGLTAANRYIQIFGEGARDSVTINGYGIANARVDWEDALGIKNIVASVFVRNIFNKIYETAATPLHNSLGFSTQQFGEPRLIGVSLSFDY